MLNRTTIIAEDLLLQRVSELSKVQGITMSDFINRAILNQLEKEGDFEVRDMLEKQYEATGGQMP